MQTRSAQPRQLLTIVTKSVTFSESRSFRGTPFGKACLKGGAGAVPAGELRIAPGRLWDTTRLAIGPVCGEPAGLDKREAGKTPASAPFQETWFWS
jgi:hypothetical protein